MDHLDTFLRILAVLGGLGGLGALLMVGVQKRKILSETGKTNAEADSVAAEAQAKRTAREVSLIEPYERVQTRMVKEMEDLYAEVDRLTTYVETLVTILRNAGLQVPPMPPKRKSAPGQDNLAARADT